MGKFIQYEHHGKVVWVNRNLKGKHTEHCLCHSCEKLCPNQETNCPIAQGNYEYCVANGLTLPVYECPEFSEGKPDYSNL